MRYVGSKNKLSKELAPIIQSYITQNTKGYLEPFVGGANMIDKIQCKKRIGCDIHEELIELLKYAQEFSGLLPERILEDKYIEVKNNKDKYEKWFVGLVGFCASFSAKYFGGYARDSKDDNSGKWSAGAIKNLKKQAPNLEGIDFKCTSFLDLPLDKINNYIIYCDIPYRDTTKYKTEKFPYEEFYKWVKDMSVHNTVLISEYNMPEEFECIWQKEIIVNIDSNKVAGDGKNIRTEKLFTYKK
jgi:site-specific DNA-adenine methylase